MFVQLLGRESQFLFRPGLLDLLGGLLQVLDHLLLLLESLGPVLLEQLSSGLSGGLFGRLERLLHLGHRLRSLVHLIDLLPDGRLLADQLGRLLLIQRAGLGGLLELLLLLDHLANLIDRGFAIGGRQALSPLNAFQKRQ